MNNVNEMNNENHGGSYTSQAAERYLRFPTTVSPCSDWLLCQAEAVCTNVLIHIQIMVGKLVNVKAVSWLINMHTATLQTTKNNTIVLKMYNKLNIEQMGMYTVKCQV